MINNIFISVVVPLYNYQNYIKDCIKSVLNQTYCNFELIIVDDCSKDDSYARAKKFEKKDARVKVIRLEKNRGYSAAKNEGIVISKGEYIATLDADDMMTKISIKSRLKVAKKQNVPFVYADALKVYNNISLKECYRLDIEQIKRHRIPTAAYETSLDLYNIHAQSVLMHRSIYEDYGLYDENLRARSDREMWWRLFGKSVKDVPKIQSYHLREVVAYYRHHRQSMWRKRKRDKKYDKLVIKMSEKAYQMRSVDGITRENTRFLRKAHVNL